MSEDPFRCPQCGHEFDWSGPVSTGPWVEIVLSCYQCPYNWSVGIRPENVKQL